MEREVEEKTALMTSARKAVRDYKDKLRVGETVERDLRHDTKRFNLKQNYFCANILV